MSEILVEVKRGSSIESIHRGNITVVDAEGNLISCVGNPHVDISMRSCAKPLQAIPVVASGASEYFGFTEKELALFCGSLNGQDFHVETLKGILKKIGLTENDLLCGVHPPSHRPTAKQLQKSGIAPGPLHNNCAGKHCAMLAMCVFNGWPISNYLPLEHPVQQLILSLIAETAEVEQDSIKSAIDGCGVPVFFIPLKNLALSYAKLAQPFGRKKTELPSTQKAIRQLMNAACKYPEMIAGDQRMCTDIMRVLGKNVFAKTGAEGGYALAVFHKGWGIAVSIEDGHHRALGPVVIETLHQLGLLSPEQKEALKGYHLPAITNHRGETVGELNPVFMLKQA